MGLSSSSVFKSMLNSVWTVSNRTVSVLSPSEHLYGSGSGFQDLYTVKSSHI